MLLLPIKSYAVFDFIADQAADIAKVSAYTSAVTDLLDEVDPHSPSAEYSKSVKNQADALERSHSEMGHTSREIEFILKGEEFSGRQLDQSIRATTNYIKRVKALLAKAAFLGPDGITAVNTAETNKTLIDIQKNQEILVLQNSQRNLSETEKHVMERRSWREFDQEQRALRQGAKPQQSTLLGRR
jgi:hypothetical protein